MTLTAFSQYGQLNWRGFWDGSNADYEPNDLVRFLGIDYVCILDLDATSLVHPAEDTTHFRPLVAASLPETTSA